MDERICLDSDILIGILRQEEKAKKIIENTADDYSTTSINVFEIWLGRKNEEKTHEMIQSLEIISLDENAAKKAAEISKDLKKDGEMLDIKDILIASVCIENGLVLATFNKKHFERLVKFGLKLADI